MAERECLIQELQQHKITQPKNFGQWKFQDGQKGGVFIREDSDFAIPALGALKAASSHHLLL
jgi:hypothetical protein